MSIKRISPGDRMSQAVVHNSIVYTAGQVSSGDTVSAQTQSILTLIEGLLKEAGSSKENMLTATIWLADINDFKEMNSVWDAWVPSGNAPARACVEAKLARDELRVEIQVTAAIV
jgi:enamine deaminase RidA (YjgF/YER057c/UK114 family)